MGFEVVELVEVFVVENRLVAEMVAEMVAVDSTKYKKDESSDLELLNILIYIPFFFDYFASVSLSSFVNLLGVSDIFIF